MMELEAQICRVHYLVRERVVDWQNGKEPHPIVEIVTAFFAIDALLTADSGLQRHTVADDERQLIKILGWNINALMLSYAKTI
nr:hypothetical protein Iba_chr07bCG10470 [Ipomoea batatas]